MSITSWRRPQSVVVGGGRAHGGSVFCALVPLCCDSCASVVPVGALFTRRRGYVRDAAPGRLLAVVCARCGPIEGGDDA